MKKKNNREYIVIGLGRFGRSVARQLEANGCRVLAVDREQKKIDKIADDVTRALCLDITNEEAMGELGLSSFDGAIVSMGHNLEAAIFAVIQTKEQGVKHIVAKAYDFMQGRILSRVGADQIVYPEYEMGKHLANDLVFGQLMDAVELTAEYSIIDLPVPAKWIGRTQQELHIRERHQVNIIAVRREGALEIVPAVEKPFAAGDILVLLGSDGALNRLKNEV